MKILNSIITFLQELEKEYGIGSLLITALCLLGVLNIGVIFTIAISDKILFFAIWIVFLIYFKPEQWAWIREFFKNLFSR